MSGPRKTTGVVLKVGGSLFDRPDLRRGLRYCLEVISGERHLLVPGGGPTAQAVRVLDRCHGLGEETSHWLALEALALNAHFLARLLPDAVVVGQVGDCQAPWSAGRPCILDAHAFALADEGRTGCLPHSWQVTSDSLAARVAEVAGAGRLILLKSVTFPRPVDWAEASRRGLVDAYFPQALPAGVEVNAVNCRVLWG